MTLENMGVQRQHSGPPEKAPEDVRLQDGTPLYYQFLTAKARMSGVASPGDTQQAHDKLRGLFAEDKDKVLSCEGKSAKEAIEILSTIGDEKIAA